MFCDIYEYTAIQWYFYKKKQKTIIKHWILILDKPQTSPYLRKSVKHSSCDEHYSDDEHYSRFITHKWTQKDCSQEGRNDPLQNLWVRVRHSMNTTVSMKFYQWSLNWNSQLTEHNYILYLTDLPCLLVIQQIDLSILQDLHCEL